MKIKSSLRTKMIVIIAVLTAVLLSFEGIVSLTITQKAYKRTLKGSYENEADYVLAKVDGWLLEYQSLMASAQSVVSASTSAEDVVKLQKVLVDLNGNNEDVEMVYIVFNNGVIVAGNGWVQPTGFSDLDSDFYRRAIAADGAFITTAPYMSNKTLVDQGAIITMARHFKLNNWEGVVAIDINLDKFKAKVDKLIEESGEEGDYAILAVTDILDSKKIVDGETIYSKYLNEKDMDDPDARSITTLDGGVYLKALEFDPVENTNFYKDRNGTSVCVTGAKNTSTGWEVLYVSPSTHYTKQVNSNKNQVFVVFVICVLVAIAVSAVVGIMVAKPIVDASKKVNKLSEDIASGTADLTVSIDTRSKDELGVLVYGINNLLKALGMMMSDIYGASKTLTDNVKNLKSAARSTSDNVATISATMEEMSASSEETSASTSQVTQQINDITGLTTKVSGDTAEKTKEIDTDIKKVDVLRGKIETNDANMMKRLNTAIEALQEKIKATKKVEDIQKMTEGISDVASQTNLLSLNASIEAARAGEMGKGFAVVADEIGKLANNSAGMARNIQEVSDEVLAIVEELVKSAEEVSDIMLKIAKENSEEKTNLIDEYISTLNGCYDSMASISESNVEIAQAIGMISDSIKAIDIAVEENAQGITSVAEGAAVLVTVSDDVMNGANEIGDITDDLSAKVSGYKF